MTSTVKKGRADWKTAAIRALSVLVYPPILMLAVLVLIGAWYVLAPMFQSPAAPGGTNGPGSAGTDGAMFTAERVTRLTDSGAADRAALSSDGRYVVHVKREGGLPSVWVRQTATTSDVQIVPPAETDILGVTFSPDDDYVYYVSRFRTDGRTVLYRIPTLGGVPGRVLENITSAPGFSPDGDRMAFVRGRTDLIVSGRDGADAQKRASVLGEYFFWSGRTTEVAWSPDGRTILVPACRREMNCSVLAVDARTGAIKEVSGGWIWLNSVKWMPDGRSFITDGPMASRTSQLWQVRYPSGERRRVTNDLNGYEFASLSRDGRILATVQYTDEAQIWMVSAGGGKAKALALRPGSGFGANGIAWTPDGRYLVFPAEAAGRYQLWIAPATGGEARQLTNHETGFSMPADPAVSPDGRWVYYSLYGEQNTGIWRVGMEGSDQEALTTGRSDYKPLVSPDNRWLYFMSVVTGRSRVMKMKTDGTAVSALCEAPFLPIGIKPDDTQLIGVLLDDKGGIASKGLEIAELPVKGGTPLLLGETPATDLVGYTPDGAFITYVARRDGRSNVFGRPCGGGPERQMTHFSDNAELYAAAWSRDGRLAVSRWTERSDVVLIRSK